MGLLPENDPRILRLDYPGRNALLRLTRSARAVLFPSIFEGFCLPVLEAMSLGTPVLTGNGTSLPEVAGDAALLVDPYSTAAIAAGIARLDGDAGLREQLAAAGPIQAEPRRLRESARAAGVRRQELHGRGGGAGQGAGECHPPAALHRARGRRQHAGKAAVPAAGASC